MKVWAIVGATLCLATAGCASLDFTPRSKTAQQTDMSGYFAERLEVGRAHLAAGRPTKAIEAFRQASYNNALAPEAFNGMAVAYSTLGRDDVARDLFARAADLDPTDQRYWRNLARVDERIMLAKQTPRLAPPAAEATVVAPTATAAAEEDDAPQARPLRMAKAKEVFIRTLPASQASGAKVPEKKLEGAIVRSAILVTAPRPRSDYPIRVNVTPTRKIAAASRQAEGTTSLPIRIFLNKN